MNYHNQSEIKRLWWNGESVRFIAGVLGINHNTIYYHIKKNNYKRQVLST